jgi:hypothetical protein
MFGNWLKGIATGVGTFLGGPAGGMIAGGLAGMIGGNRQAGAYDRAGANAANRANQGFNWLNRSVIGKNYLPAGGAATDQMRDLLGLGDDPAAAQAAFEEWQNSTGFQNRLEQGSNAITGNRAARGALGSGATLKALQSRGQEQGTESFGNYFAQLMGLSNMGLEAGNMIGNAATQGGVAGAQAGLQASGAAADARARGFDELVGGLGGAYETWRTGREGATATAAPAASERRMWSIRPELARTPAQPLNFIRTIR